MADNPYKASDFPIQVAKRDCVSQDYRSIVLVAKTRKHLQKMESYFREKMRKCLQEWESYFSIEKRIVEYFGKKRRIIMEKKSR